MVRIETVQTPSGKVYSANAQDLSETTSLPSQRFGTTVISRKTLIRFSSGG
jgi:hypothetical protein